ncbi:MAG: formate dehydrogenase subunit alpha, partial [Shewanella sp.]|nr:formate dehydrogenase subunit alpha [Shewanella sp.]
NRCISCGACVDMCQRQSGHKAICFEPNSFSALPSCSANDDLNQTAMRRSPRAGFSVSMADSNCVQCGNCVQVCPTGALVDARDKSQARAKAELEKISTVCTYCGVGCRVEMHVDKASNRIMRVTGDTESQVNEGMLCVKGRFGFDFVQSPERLTTPLIRKNGKLVPASWDEAVTHVASRLTDIKARYGSDAIATLASAKATNEDNFLLQKFTRAVLGTNNIDHCARLCHASTVSALYDTLGGGAMTNDIPGIKESDLIFILGSDTSIAHPIIASRIREAINHRKARLVVVDPKRVEIADSAKLYLSQRPGTDVMLLNAIMQQIFLNGWQDDTYIAERTEQFEAVRDEVMKSDYSLDNAAIITGIAAEDIAKLARLIGTADKTAIYYAMGITQHTCGHDNVLAISNLQLMLGNIGVEGAGINPLRGQSNVQGSCDMGALPNYLPGYKKLVEAANRAPIEAAWNVTLPTQEGIPASYMMKALVSGKLKAMYIMGENPVLSDADQAHVLDGLAAAEFIVVQDIFLTETAALADVVLPAAAFAEKRGHFTNTERRVQQLQVAVTSPGMAKPDWQIVQAVANAMGADWHYEAEEQIWREVNQLTPQYRGISWERVAPTTIAGKQGLQWPCLDEQHPGTRIMHQSQFIRGTQAKFEPVSFRLPAEMPCDEYPLVLSTGRLLEQFHTGTLTRKTQGLDLLASPRVMISVFDADKLGVNNGDMLRLVTRRGEINIRAFVTRRAQAGVLFLPFHFVEAAANKLTINALDPVAHIPEYKFCAVRAENLGAMEGFGDTLDNVKDEVLNDTSLESEDIPAA